MASACICEDVWQHRRPQLEKDQLFYGGKCSELDGLIKQAYAANVIPDGYRNVYVVKYLLGLGETGIAYGVDTALRAFELKRVEEQFEWEIKPWLDVETDGVLKRAREVAAQKSQEQFRHEMVGRLDRIGVSGEERSLCMSMIDSVVKATFWMATVDYL